MSIMIHLYTVGQRARAEDTSGGSIARLEICRWELSCNRCDIKSNVIKLK
ncbi:MAG: hypothetical protein FWD71_16860 [Oscillospiraceae bacterium]|nr:hypothetical protein [Oscillospiraceae bacterium]